MDPPLARVAPRRILRLPALVAYSRTKLIYLVYWAPFIAIYQLLNRWPLIEPRELHLTWLDRWLPFVPELLPIYVAYLPFFYWSVARLQTDEQVNRIFYATHLQLLLSMPFFLFFPVRMPRELYYDPVAFNWADSFWRWFDGPNNCFPSLHVSNCLLLMQFNRRRTYRGLHTAIGVAIIVSTVLVKQHYVVDVAGGAAVYLLSRQFLAHLEIDTRRAPRSERSL